MDTINNINIEQDIKIICFNNFYKNPYDIRKYLLNKEFNYNEETNIYDFLPIINLNNLLKTLKDIMGNNIIIKNNSFHLNINNECDESSIRNSNYCEWTAVIFLSLHPKIDCGIKFYKLENSDSKSNFILEDKIGNIFNRIVIFKSKYYNSIGAFGVDNNDGNIYQKILFSIKSN
jgi:hypothetical protein